jgi:hydrogenase expression/formation protein HypE
MNSEEIKLPSCPFPISDYPRVLLAHGGGGRLMHQLIKRLFVSAFGYPDPSAMHDGVVSELDSRKLAFTTDSYVVDPLFFPGGDIGSLAVYGTVNDLTMCGARPLYLSVGFIIEEGFPMESLWKIASSMRRAADNVDVRIVTGDTKVVERGKGHGLFINTSGVGSIEHKCNINPKNVEAGDVIVINGDIGRHGIAIMARREGLEFETTIESDCAPLVDPVMQLLDGGLEVHCLRDLTRGGLASVLVEIAEASGLHLRVSEADIPVRSDVRAACEILGFDPIYVANEGRFVAFMPKHDAAKGLAIFHARGVWPEARIIGEVLGADGGMVTMKSLIGSERIVDMLSGEQLPRIC